MVKNLCGKCGKSFTVAGLKAHLNRKTPCDKVLKCPTCNKTFKLQASYDKHIISCKLEFLCELPNELANHEVKESAPIDNISVLTNNLELYSNYVQKAIHSSLDEHELKAVDDIIEKTFKASLNYITYKHIKLNNIDSSKSVDITLKISENKN